MVEHSAEYAQGTDNMATLARSAAAARAPEQHKHPVHTWHGGRRRTERLGGQRGGDGEVTQLDDEGADRQHGTPASQRDHGSRGCAAQPGTVLVELERARAVQCLGPPTPRPRRTAPIPLDARLLLYSRWWAPYSWSRSR